MSDMKCPKCCGKLVYWGATGALLKCSQCHFGLGNEELWQKLIRTRKALDILLFTINRLENQNYKDCAWHLRLAIAKIEATDIANEALEQRDK